MRIILLGLLCLPFFLGAQQQVTSHASDIVSEHTLNYHHITDSGDEYLFRKGGKYYWVYKIEGEKLVFQAQLDAAGETRHSICEDLRDCLDQNFFIEMYEDRIRVNDFINNQMVFDFELDDFLNYSAEDFSIIDNKVYVHSQKNNDGLAYVGIYNYLDNSFQLISDPNYNFLGRNGKHMFFANLDHTKIYYYDENENSFDLMYTSSSEFVQTVVSQTANGHALIVESVEDPFILIESRNAIRSFECAPLDFSIMSDLMLMKNKLVYLELDEDLFDGNVVLYDFDDCTETKRKSIVSLFGSLSSSQVLGEDYVFFQSVQVYEGYLGDKGYVDIDKDTIVRTFIHTVDEINPKYAILNGDKFLMHAKSKVIDWGPYWHSLAEIDLSTGEAKLHKLIFDEQSTYQSLPYGSMPYGENITDFSVFTSSEFDGFTHLNYEITDNGINKTLVNKPFTQPGGLTGIGQYTSFDDKLFFTHENSIDIYEGINLLESRTFDGISDFAVYPNGFTVGFENQSDRKIYHLSKGSHEPGLVDADSPAYLWGGDRNQIAENGYFIANIASTPIRYFELSSLNEVTVTEENNSSLNGTVKGVSGFNVIAYKSLTKEYFIYNTQNRNLEPLSDFTNLPSIRFRPIENNGFIANAWGNVNGAPITEYFRIKEDGDWKKIGEFNFGLNEDFEILINDTNGYLLSIFDNNVITLISEKDDAVSTITLNSSAAAELYYLENKVLITSYENETEKVHIYDFENEPIEIENTPGKLLSVNNLNDTAILFFQEASEISAYRLNTNNTLDLLGTHENLIEYRSQSDKFIDVYNENKILLPLTTSQYGKELFLFDLQTNEFKLLNDLNPNGSANPDHFTRNGRMLYFTALIDNNNRQWHQLLLSPTSKAENFSPQEPNVLSPSLVENNIFFAIDLDELIITNTSGQLLKSITDYSALNLINIQGFASGLYFLHGKKDEECYIAKFYKH